MNEATVAPVMPVYHTMPRLTRDHVKPQQVNIDNDDKQDDDKPSPLFMSLDDNVGMLLDVSAHRLTRK